MSKTNIFRSGVIVYVLILAVTWVSCAKTKQCDVNTSRKMPVQAFQKVNLETDFETVIKQSDSSYVIMEGCATDLDAVQFSRDGDKIILKRKGKGSGKGVKLFIGTAELSQLTSGGTVNVTATGFNSDIDRSIQVSGTGSVRFAGNASSLVADADGTSKIEVTGEAESIRLHLRGVTTFSGYGMPAQHYTVSLSGDSRATVHVASSLDGEVSGTSELRYKGNAVERVATRDLGKVIKEQ